jgi:hypothetical protein
MSTTFICSNSVHFALTTTQYTTSILLKIMFVHYYKAMCTFCYNISTTKVSEHSRSTSLGRETTRLIGETKIAVLLGASVEGWTQSFGPCDWSSVNCVDEFAFWDVAPCSLVDIDRRFRRTYRLHHQGDRKLPF